MVSGFKNDTFVAILRAGKYLITHFDPALNNAILLKAANSQLFDVS
jgi:hypothetical protein